MGSAPDAYKRESRRPAILESCDNGIDVERGAQRFHGINHVDDKP